MDTAVIGSIWKSETRYGNRGYKDRYRSRGDPYQPHPRVQLRQDETAATGAASRPPNSGADWRPLRVLLQSDCPIARVGTPQHRESGDAHQSGRREVAAEGNRSA